jgi:hypothetical protein
MRPGRYEYVFDNLDGLREVVGTMVVTPDGRIAQVTGMLCDEFKDGMLVIDGDIDFRLYRLSNGYFTLRPADSD